MTISSTKTRITHEGNGAATSFPYDFLIPTSDDLKVYLYTEAGGEVEVAAAEYSVSGLGSEAFGEVTYPLSGDPIEAGTYLIIAREVAYTQPVDITNQSTFFPSVIEGALDRRTMAEQQLAEAVDRAPKLPNASSLTDILLPMPDAGKALRWNDAGDGFTNSEDDVDGIVSAATASATAAANSASASASSATASATSAAQAEEWANNDEDVEISFSPGNYSAKNWALKAAAYAASIALPLVPGDGNFLQYSDAEAGYIGLTAAEVVTELGVPSLNADDGISLTTTTTTQNYMPASRYTGTWKAANVLDSTDPATFGGVRSTAAIVRNVEGSGTNGPGTSDYNLFLIANNSDLTSTTVGELGALRFLTFANGYGDKDIFIGSILKAQGDGSASEGAALAYELGVRIFQNNDLTDLVSHHQILGAFVPNPGSTWGAETSIGYYSEKYIGTGFAHFLGIDQGSGGTGSMTYGIALFNTRSSTDYYFRVNGGGEVMESRWTDAGVTGGIWRRYKNSASPAANDVIWSDYWRGKDSAGNDTDYVRMYAGIKDATDASEDGTWTLRTLVNGSEFDQITIANGVAIGGPASGTLGTGSINIATVLAIGGTSVLDSSRGVRFRSYTAAEIASATNAVNTTDKVAGKSIWDSTNNRILTASGSAATSTWIVANGTVAITPA